MLSLLKSLILSRWFSAAFIVGCCVVAHAEPHTTWTRSFARIPELEYRIALAAENVSQVMDPASGKPYFGAALLDPRPHFYHIDHFDVPHLTGRVLDSLLMSEQVVGTTVSQEVVDEYAALIYSSFDGPDALNSFRERGGARKVVLHNLREGMSGLVALIRARNDENARRVAHRMVRRISDLMHADGSWNYEAIKNTPNVLQPGEVAGHDTFYTSTAGRFLGALVKYYETTGDEEALKLARRIANKALTTCFAPNGKYTEAAGWHVHSITATINSLAQFAECTNDAALLDQVEKIYLRAFDGIITSFGWSKENLSNDLDTGEVNNTGDIMQTALILARNGKPKYYADVERMLRSHVLPSQLLDVSWVHRIASPDWDDRHRDVAERTRGAFGFPAPYGHKIDRIPHVNFNFDITCGTAQALCEVARAACEETPEEIEVRLLFSMKAPGLRLRSMLPDAGELEVETSGTKRLRVRLPDGVVATSVSLLTNKKAYLVQVEDGFLNLGAEITSARITFPLPESVTEEKLPGRTARAHWKGEQMIRLQSSGTFLPFIEEKN